jgi:hypothetical protein
MTDAIRLGPDVDWYVQNLDRITAFRSYLINVEKDLLTKQVVDLVRSAASSAVEDLDLSVDSDTSTVWWFARGSMHPDTYKGAFVQVDIPKDAHEWLVDADDWPELGLYTCSGNDGKSKTDARKFAQMIRSRMKDRAEAYQFDERNYLVVRKRSLRDEITALKLRKPDELHRNLIKTFRDFTNAVLPGLRLPLIARQRISD